VKDLARTEHGADVSDYLNMTAAQSSPISIPFSGKLALLARDIKISHSVFAMPWAILSAVIAWHRVGGSILGKLGIILVCMATARTMAMASNRLLDAELDRRNPRTARRAIPSGQLSSGFVTAAMLLCAAIFIAATSLFWIVYANPWPMMLALPVLAFLSAYPLLKRFTRLCHFYLGAALALAPICAWVAVSGTIAWPPILMAGALLIVEHAIVKPNDLSKVGIAFFTINGVISLLVGILGVIDVVR